MRIGIDWKQLVAGARDRGRAALELYVIHTRPAADAAAVEAQLKAHLEHQTRIEAEGVMFAAGPVGDADGVSWRGEGMIVVRAASLADATRIAESDPMHRSGARTFTVRPWVVCEGSIDVRLHCSDRSMQLR